ncbi:hypothetical protein CC78DRAFT_618564 [Lojkania enalia]|uniref:Uncharacterized protein n=1 Tax=Lojkania enalia TaxID=147567 RepID=A0A9P4MYC1_9PLEO|nr:hypothetical protein CC78DRAFT_618564 [Didymosphaeria enalia]
MPSRGVMKDSSNAEDYNSAEDRNSADDNSSAERLGNVKRSSKIAAKGKICMRATTIREDRKDGLPRKPSLREMVAKKRRLSIPSPRRDPKRHYITYTRRKKRHHIDVSGSSYKGPNASSSSVSTHTKATRPRREQRSSSGCPKPAARRQPLHKEPAHFFKLPDTRHIKSTTSNKLELKDALAISDFITLKYPVEVPVPHEQDMFYEFIGLNGLKVYVDALRNKLEDNRDSSVEDAVGAPLPSMEPPKLQTLLTNAEHGLCGNEDAVATSSPDDSSGDEDETYADGNRIIDLSPNHVFTDSDTESDELVFSIMRDAVVVHVFVFVGNI